MGGNAGCNKCCPGSAVWWLFWVLSPSVLCGGIPSVVIRCLCLNEVCSYKSSPHCLFQGLEVMCSISCSVVQLCACL